jgi:hypothetical protein
MLASLEAVGLPDLVADGRGLSLIFYTLIILILFTTIYSTCGHRPALIWAALFASSSGAIPVTMSGMETPLFLLAMALAIRGFLRKSPLLPIGLALAVLTRIDGLLLAAVFLAWDLLACRRSALKRLALFLLLISPWLVFSTSYFGGLLPQSARAKAVAYHFGAWKSAAPFLMRFTPFGETSPSRFLAKSMAFCLVILGIVRTVMTRRDLGLLPLAAYYLLYCLAFMTSGVLIFPWYLTPATFAYDILLALGASYLVTRALEPAGTRTRAMLMAAVLITVIGMNLATLSSRLQEYREIQRIEDRLRAPIGRWLKENAGPGASVFLEPIGYIGYHAGPDVKIIDEVGIISPAIVRFRREGAGWYLRALEALKPDYIVEYTYSIENNRVEATGEPLFQGRADLDWFHHRYKVVRTFEACGTCRYIKDKEKGYAIFKANTSVSTTMEGQNTRNRTAGIDFR